jgi:O-antigen ligase
MKLINNLILFLIYLNSATLLVPDKFKAFPIVILLVLVIYRYFKLDEKPVLSTKTYIISITFFIIILFSALYSNDFDNALKKIESGLSLLVFPTIFYLISGDLKIINKKTIVNVKRTFIFSTILFLFLTFVYFYLSEPYFTFRSTLVHYTNLVDIRIENYKIHPIYLSISVGVAIIFLATIIKTKEQKAVVFLWICLVFLIIFMGILNKKGPILALVVIGFVILFKTKINHRQLCYGVLIFLLLLVSAIFLPKYNNVNKFSELFDLEGLKKNKNSSTAIRLQIYECSLNKIYEAPIFGYGVGDVQMILNECYSLKNKSLTTKIYNSHNQFLSILLATGFIGFISFVYCIFYFLKISKNQESQALFLLILYLCMNMLTENILERADGVIISSFLINFFIYCKKHEPNLIEK